MGKLRVESYDVTFDASYPAGGEPFNEALIGGKLFKEIEGVSFVGGNAASAAYLFQWDTTNKKIIVSYPTGGGTSPAAVADPVVAVTVPAGATPVTSDAAQPDLVEVLTPGRGKEVAAATDLTSLTVRVQVVGF
jgi:hypothetical protein